MSVTDEALARDPSAPASRELRILVILGHSLDVRAMAGSGALTRLAERGHRVTALVPESDIEDITDGNSSIEVLPLEPYAPRGWRRRLRAYYAQASIVQRRASPTYRSKLNAVLKRRADRVRRRTLLWASYVADLEAAIRGIERRLAPSRNARRLIRRLRPDVVFASTLIHLMREVELFKAANRQGIPTAAFPVSWDTLTSKGFFPIPPDYLIVWGEANRTHAARYHATPADRVYVTGAPHLDIYGPEMPSEPRTGFLSARGIDPAGNVILFAGSSINYMADEPLHVEALSKMVQAGDLGNCVIWYRPHPRRPFRQISHLLGIPGVHMDDEMVRHKQSGKGSWATSPEALTHYRSLLDACDGLVTRFSTLMIEMALLGKPSLALEFGLDEMARRNLHHHFAYEHARDTLAMPGITTCHSLDEVKTGIRRILEGGFADRADEMRAAAAKVAFNLDGGARGRLALAIEDIADRHSPGAAEPKRGASPH